MGLLSEAKMEQSAAKIGVYGPQGSGKTTVCVMLALGASLTYHKGAPIAFFDTEKGSDFTEPMVRAEGVKLLRSKSRAFRDLLSVVAEAEQAGCCALVVDSMTHVWNELMDAFARQKHLKRIEFHHWREIKAEWRRWVDLMLNSRMHIFIAGRAGNIYEYQENDETGKKELITSGTKMKAEGEFGYEPDILLELWNERTDAKAGSRLIHKAMCLKDRSWHFNGHEFEWPDKPSYKKSDWKAIFEKLSPYFEYLSIGGPNVNVEASRTSDEMFTGENAYGDAYAAKKRKEQLLEEIENTLTLVYPGSDQKSKRAKLLLIEAVFGLRTWAGVCEKSNRDLADGKEWLMAFEKEAAGETPHEDKELLSLLAQCKPIPDDPAGPISPSQLKQLWAKSSELGWDESGLHRALDSRFGIKSTKQIPSSLFDNVMQMIESGT